MAITERRKRIKRPLQNRDRNRDTMRTLGREARDEGHPLAAGPRLLDAIRDDEHRALQLIASWRLGWLARDVEIRSPRLALKGAD